MAVTISYRKYKVVPVTTVWFNAEPVLATTSPGMFYSLQQSVALTDTGSAVCVSQSTFDTSIIDLTRPVEQLHQDLAPKSCRYEIRKIKKLIEAGESVYIKNDPEINSFLKMANRYISRKSYTHPLRRQNLEIYIENKCGELMTIYSGRQLIGGNFYIRDYPSRVRLLYSFNDRFDDVELQKLSGAYMRHLHWEAIKRYKTEGFQNYDTGGVNLDEQSDTYGITKFKLSFGGNIRQEYNYVFASNTTLAKLCKIYKKLSPNK